MLDLSSAIRKKSNALGWTEENPVIVWSIVDDRRISVVLEFTIHI
jgi:hypothetical protein